MLTRAGQAIIVVVCLALLICPLTADASRLSEGLKRDAVILLAGGPAGQAQLHALKTAMSVGGYAVVVLSPQNSSGGLSGMAERIKKAAKGLLDRDGIGDLALVAHGAAGFAAFEFVQTKRPDRLKRLILIAAPLAGLSLPKGGSPCKDDWRNRIEKFYGSEGLKQAAPGGNLTKLIAKGLPLDITAASISGRLNKDVAETMAAKAGCAKELSALPGDGVTEKSSIAGLPGFGRDDRAYTALGDHLSLPANRNCIKQVLRLLKLPTKGGSASVAIVVDGSGSVRRQKDKELRRQAVIMLLERLSVGDRVALAGFNTGGYTVLPLSLIKSADTTKQIIEKLYLPSAGDTNIDAGLKKSLELLGKAPDVSRRIVVLISDGRNDPESNNGPTLDTARRLAAKDVEIHAVGLTGDVDELFLSRLANLSDGAYYAVKGRDSLAAVFDRLQAEIEGNSLLLSATDKAPAAYKFPVDSTISRIDIKLAGPVDKLGLELFDAAGNKVKANSAVGKGHAVYSVENPAPGQWQAKLTGGGEAFELQIMADSGLMIKLNAKQEPLAGAPWPVSISATQDDAPLANCKAVVTVSGPDGKTVKTALAPQQSGGFSASISSAGALSGQIKGLSDIGDHMVKAVVTGKNNLGEDFRRVLVQNVHVAGKADIKVLKRTLQGRSLPWRGNP